MPIILPTPTPSRAFISSPLKTFIPRLTPAQIASLPYPPDLYSGARDVTTPFGSLRVYELGHETGRKVLLVHGDSTAAPLWKGIVPRLLERGCRVMVLDTWGRGYTDTPMVPHTPRLFGLALLFAVASSPLPWTAEGFSITGFSLGGGVTMDFVASYPHLIKSVVLLAPAGLLRSLPPSYEALIASAWAAEDESSLRAKLADVLEVENVRLEQGVKDEDLSFEGMSLGAWQFHYHEGHLASFASTVCHGPIKDQDGVWKQACAVLKTQSRDTGPRREKLLVVCGAEDFIVVAEELKGNLERLMGKNEFTFETVPGGHGFPVPEAERVVEIIAREWEL